MIRFSGYWLVALLVVAGLASGCCTMGSRSAAKSPPEIVAVRASGPIHADGTLDEPAWASAPAYPLGLSDDALAEGKTLIEGGTVKFLWPDDHTWYWEMYVTPRNKQTTCFFPSDGRLLFLDSVPPLANTK